MTINDRIYGAFEITSRVLIELLSSQSLIRLKDISQMGPPNPYYHIPNYSRYEHSLGVMLLLKHLNASEEEQIAGLVHDVSHTAFSHVIDWVMGTGHIENFQDNQHEAFINATNIPQIISQHGFSLQRIVDYKHFPLLERDIPHLCADRIDYALREFTQDKARLCFSHLVHYQGVIIFNDAQIAYLFAHEFLKKQLNQWGGYEAVTRYNLFSAVLKRALHLKIIDMNDFQGTEKPIIKKLESSNDPDIRNPLEILKNKNLSFLAKDEYVTVKKFRYVDPLVLHNNSPVPLSKLNHLFSQEIENARKENALGIKGGKI